MLKKILLALPALVLLIAGSLYFIANREARAQADLLIEQALTSGAYKELSYESINVDIFSGELTINNLRVVDLQAAEYILQELTISDYDYLHEIPHHLSISLKGISFPEGLPEISESVNLAFNQYMNEFLSNNSIPVIMNYAYNFDSENNNLLKSTGGIGLENAANLSFASSIQNLPIKSLFSNSATDPAAGQIQLINTVLSAEISQASFSLTDLGLVETFITIRAEQDGITTDDFYQQLNSIVNNLYVFAPPSAQQVAMQAGSELGIFLEGNRTFNLSITPEYNGSIQQLQPEIIGAIFSGEYGVILDLLNLEFQTQ